MESSNNMEMSNLAGYIRKVGEDIQAKSSSKNKHLKALVAESKKELVEMLDTSYQDAFSIETKMRRKGR